MCVCVEGVGGGGGGRGTGSWSGQKYSHEAKTIHVNFFQKALLLCDVSQLDKLEVKKRLSHTGNQ